MKFSEAIATCLGKYATFKGRALRSEYWWFYLFVLLVTWASTMLSTVVMGEQSGIFETIVTLVLFLPSIAAATRRLHDVGRSGWWQLLYLTVIGGLLVIYWLAKKGDSVENHYGPPLSAA